MYDVVTIMNTIRDNASAEYQARVPATTKTNIESVGAKITEFTATTNEFLGALVNRIAMTVIETKTFNNPLAILKKGGVPLGRGIEQIYTNPSKAQAYNYSSEDLLKLVSADVKTNFYNLNRQDKYPVSITVEMLSQAFTSFTEMSRLIDSIVNALYSGDEIDEFILMKNLIKTAHTNNHIFTVNIYDENAATINDETISKELVKQIKTYSNLFTFPSSNYNKYKSVETTDSECVTWSPLKDQILILDSVVSSVLDVEVLAYAFNLDKAQIQTQTLKVDNFNGAPILGMLCDKSFFQVRDNMKKLTSFYNPDNLSTKYILHHWQTYGYSLLANSIAFTYTPKTV